MAFKHLLLALVMPTASYAKKRRRNKRRPDSPVLPPQMPYEVSKGPQTNSNATTDH